METYEKRYREALKWIESIYTELSHERQMEAEAFFPELKESVYEKNIKNLIDELKCSLRAANCQNEACNGGHEKRIALLEWAIAWLEKQGEQKPTDKAEPKFKVGDIMRTIQEASDNITSGLPIIVSIDKEYYHCTNELIAIRDQDGYEYPPMNRIQKPAWTIQDAKDGDILTWDDKK